MALCGFTYREVTVWGEPPPPIYLFTSSSEKCRLLKAVGGLVFVQQKRFFLRSQNKGLNKDVLVTLLVLHLKNKPSGLLAWPH